MSFQFFPVPVGHFRSGLVSALQKIEQRLTRRGGLAGVIVHQQKLFHLGMIKSRGRLNFLLGKAGWFGRGIGIECRTLDLASAGPDSRTDHFVGLRFAGDGIRAGAFGSAATGKARHRQVEAAPEKMHRTVFADEAGAKFLENIVG